MRPTYPLQFQPLFRRYLWGGRQLGTLLGKPIGDGDDYAESWEIVDHGSDQSLVLNGPLAGTPLNRLIDTAGADLLGRHAPQPQFPLLLKFLDCHQNLSVQVHPNDQQAARLDPPDRGKTEAWIVLHAEPGSLIYAGLREGVDRDDLARQVAAGQTASCLHRFEPRVGDCVFIPAGTVHALGAGLMIAEIQQASDTTFRLYDWDRRGPDGQPRPLHIEQALEVIDYQAGPVRPQQPEPTPDRAGEQLVTCDHFVLQRRRFERPFTLGGDDRFHLLAVVEGVMSIASPHCAQPLQRGEVVLIPAAAGSVELLPQEGVTMLEIFLP